MVLYVCLTNKGKFLFAKQFHLVYVTNITLDDFVGNV